MTEVMEIVHVTIDEVVEHQEDSCPFCRENEKPDPLPVSKIVDNWDEDKAAARHDMIGNSSGTLETNMKAEGNPRPTDWRLRHEVRKCNGETLDLGDDHVVKANPHHLVPGNESLKKCPQILKWIFEKEGLITNDIGYDVNRAQNGVWLPSNNGMRGNPDYACETVKITYANAAQPNGGSFHDRHVDYSKFVKRTLKKIADRMDGIEAQQPDCEYKTDKQSDGKFNPPWALVHRLDGVSRKMAGYLQKYNVGHGFRAPIYASRLSLDRNKILVDASRGASVQINCPVCQIKGNL
jgi:hypothetical protein